MSEHCKHPPEQAESLFCYEWCSVCGAIRNVGIGSTKEWKLPQRTPTPTENAESLCFVCGKRPMRGGDRQGCGLCEQCFNNDL